VATTGTSVNKLILVLTTHGKLLYTNAYLQHLEFPSHTDSKVQSHDRVTEKTRAQDKEE